jgi:hypothetical protein
MLTREQERAAVQSMILRLAMICNQRGGGSSPSARSRNSVSTKMEGTEEGDANEHDDKH